MKIVNPELSRRLDNGETFALELGVGPERGGSDYFTLDIVPFEGADIVADLNEKLDLIPDSSVSALYSRHTLEHVRNLTGLMEEIQRICVPGAEIRITVPHFSNPFGHSDPTHLRLFGAYSMYYFSDAASQPKRKVPSYYSKARFKVEDIHIRFYRLDRLDRITASLVERLVNRSLSSKLFYERHFAYLFPAMEVRFVLRNDK